MSPVTMRSVVCSNRGSWNSSPGGHEASVREVGDRSRAAERSDCHQDDHGSSHTSPQSLGTQRSHRSLSVIENRSSAEVQTLEPGRRQEVEDWLDSFGVDWEYA